MSIILADMLFTACLVLIFIVLAHAVRALIDFACRGLVIPSILFGILEDLRGAEWGARLAKHEAIMKHFLNLNAKQEGLFQGLRFHQ